MMRPGRLISAPRSLLLAALPMLATLVVAPYAMADARDDWATGTDKAKDGHYEEAIEHYNRALDSDELNQTDRASVIYSRGLIKGRLDDHDGALADYRKALALNPTHVRTLGALCFQLSRRNELNEALQHCNEALRQDAGYAPAYGIRADIWRWMKNYLESENDYAYAIRLQPDNFIYYINRSVMYEEWGKPERARADMETAYDMAPDWTHTRGPFLPNFRKYGLVP